MSDKHDDRFLPMINLHIVGKSVAKVLSIAGIASAVGAPAVQAAIATENATAASLQRGDASAVCNGDKGAILLDWVSTDPITGEQIVRHYSHASHVSHSSHVSHYSSRP